MQRPFPEGERPVSRAFLDGRGSDRSRDLPRVKARGHWTTCPARDEQSPSKHRSKREPRALEQLADDLLGRHPLPLGHVAELPFDIAVEIELVARIR
jgi:hypothetical protein